MSACFTRPVSTYEARLSGVRVLLVPTGDGFPYGSRQLTASCGWDGPAANRHSCTRTMRQYFRTLLKRREERPLPRNVSPSVSRTEQRTIHGATAWCDRRTARANRRFFSKGPGRQTWWRKRSREPRDGSTRLPSMEGY